VKGLESAVALSGVGLEQSLAVAPLFAPLFVAILLGVLYYANKHAATDAAKDALIAELRRRIEDAKRSSP